MAIRQLHALGITDTMVSDWAHAGRLHRVHRGVYTVGTRRLSAKGRWLAGVLACGDGTLLGVRAGGALHQLRPRPSGPVDVWVVAKGRRDRPGIRVHCARRPPPGTVVDGIPVTTVARTLLDLAVVLDAQQLRLAVEAAERRGTFDLREIDALQTRGHHGASALDAAIAAAFGNAPWTRSEFENAFLAFLRARGLPEPQVNVVVQGELADFYWPEHRLVVETDGYSWHRGVAAFENDRRRDAVFTVAGIRILRLTQRRIAGQPATVERDLRSLLDLL